MAVVKKFFHTQAGSDYYFALAVARFSSHKHWRYLDFKLTFKPNLRLIKTTTSLLGYL